MKIQIKPISFKQILISIVAFLIINLIAGYGVIWLGADIAEIYKNLNKPYFAPPTWTFGIIWTINCVLIIYGILQTINLSPTKIKDKLLVTYGFLIANYCIFQYLSFGSKILFGQLLPIMFFLPTLSMLILTIIGMKFAYQLDTLEMTLKQKIMSGKSIFASFISLFSWLLIATAVGLGVWLMN
jgi:translocator protein